MTTKSKFISGLALSAVLVTGLFAVDKKAEEMDLKELADISNFSEFHFHRIFKAIIGESVGAFVVRMRIETAARLLRYSNLSVQDIAYNVGYNTPSSLTKVFASTIIFHHQIIEITKVIKL